MKMIEGLCSLARVKRVFTNLGSFRKLQKRNPNMHAAVYNYAQLVPMIVNRTYFSLSPSHLETRSDEEMEKKVELFASVATALAR